MAALPRHSILFLIAALFASSIPALSDDTPESRAADAIRRERAKLILPLLEQAMATDGNLSDLIERTLKNRRDVLFNQSTALDSSYKYSRTLIATLFKADETRSLVVSMMNSELKQISDLAKSSLAEVDVRPVAVSEVVVGMGPEGAAYLQAKTTSDPNASILVVDRRSRPGGTFAFLDEVLRLNSTTRKYEGERAVPGRGDLNNIHDIVGLPDFRAARWSSAGGLGELSTVGTYMSSALPLLETEVIAVTKVNTPFAQYAVLLKDLNSEKTLTVFTKKVIFTTGLGETREFGDQATRDLLGKEAALAKAEQRAPQLEGGIEFLERIGDPEVKNPLKEFVGKTIAVVGAGDTGNVINEFLARLAPEGAYREDVAQTGNVKRIFWFVGLNGFRDCKEYIDRSRARYSAISQAINSGLLVPVPGKVVDIFETQELTSQRTFGVNYSYKEASGNVVDRASSTGVEYVLPKDERVGRKEVQVVKEVVQFDKVLLSTGLKSRLPQLLENFAEGKQFKEVWNLREAPLQQFKEFATVNYAREHKNAPGIFLAGPANEELGGLVREQEKVGVNANSVSLFANVERTKALANFLKEAVSEPAGRFSEILAKVFKPGAARVVLIENPGSKLLVNWASDRKLESNVAKQENVDLAFRTALQKSLSAVKLSGTQKALVAVISSDGTGERFQVVLNDLEPASSLVSRQQAATLAQLRSSIVLTADPAIEAETKAVQSLFERNALLNVSLRQIYAKNSSRSKTIRVSIPVLRSNQLDFRSMEIVKEIRGR